VCSILGGLFVPFIGGIVGIVFGVVGLRHCARNNEGGRGMAIAGIIIGGVAVFFWLLVSIGLAVGDVHSQSHHHSTDLGTLILPGLLPW
jgi:hypothetical protein